MGKAILTLRSLHLWMAILAISLIHCAEPDPPAKLDTPRPAETPAATRPAAREVKEARTGSAAFISEAFHGKKTASGDTYDQAKLVAAHPSYPMGTTVLVTNLENGRAVEVRVIDRSAAAKNAGSPIIDVSRGAADHLGFTQQGRAEVRTEVLEWGPKTPLR